MIALGRPTEVGPKKAHPSYPASTRTAEAAGPIPDPASVIKEPMPPPTIIIPIIRTMDAEA